MTTLLQNVNEEVFRTYVFWTAVLVVKMLAMSVLTGRQRFRKKVRDYNHERDTHTHIPEDPPKGGITQRGAVIFLVRMYAPTFRFFADY